MRSSDIRIIVGLGNPGAEHQGDRHNIGYRLVDRLAARYAKGGFRPERRYHGDLAVAEIGVHEVLLLKPTTWMNLSGQSVQALIAYRRYEPAQVLVVHDDLDLPVGTARLKLGGGHGGHNGLRDLIRHLGPDFMRLRIGVGHPGQKDYVTDYVLRRPTSGEQETLDEVVTESIEALPILLSNGLNRAQDRLHKRKTREAESIAEVQPGDKPVGD